MHQCVRAPTLLLCCLCLCCFFCTAFTPLLSQHISCTFGRAKVSGVLVGGVSVWWGGTGRHLGGGRCGRRVRGGGATLKGGVRVAIDVARQVGRRGRSVRGVRLVWSALMWGAASGGRWGFLSRVQGVAATQGPPSDPGPALWSCRWAAGLHRLPPPQPPAVWVHLWRKTLTTFLCMNKKNRKEKQQNKFLGRGGGGVEEKQHR